MLKVFVLVACFSGVLCLSVAPKKASTGISVRNTAEHSKHFYSKTAKPDGYQDDFANTQTRLGSISGSRDSLKTNTLLADEDSWTGVAAGKPAGRVVQFETKPLTIPLYNGEIATLPHAIHVRPEKGTERFESEVRSKLNQRNHEVVSDSSTRGQELAGLSSLNVNTGKEKVAVQDARHGVYSTNMVEGQGPRALVSGITSSNNKVRGYEKTRQWDTMPSYTGQTSGTPDFLDAQPDGVSDEEYADMLDSYNRRTRTYAEATKMDLLTAKQGARVRDGQETGWVVDKEYPNAPAALNYGVEKIQKAQSEVEAAAYAKWRASKKGQDDAKLTALQLAKTEKAQLALALAQAVQRLEEHRGESDETVAAEEEEIDYLEGEVAKAETARAAAETASDKAVAALAACLEANKANEVAVQIEQCGTSA